MSDHAVWPSVSRDAPCPVCGRADRCRVAADGGMAWCDREAHGAIRESGGGWIHALCPGGHGQARRTPRPAAPTRPTTSYATADEAITAVRLAIRGGATLAGRWTYHRADGAEHMIVARYDVASTPPTKQYRPINLADDGRWRIGDPTAPLPLYRLPELLASTADVIYVCEGEKCAMPPRTSG